MPKWEYQIVSSFMDTEQWRPRFVNGKELSNWKTGDLVSYCNQVGAQGWELVHVEIATVYGARTAGPISIGLHAYESKEASYRLFFKRPLE